MNNANPKTNIAEVAMNLAARHTSDAKSMPAPHAFPLGSNLL